MKVPWDLISYLQNFFQLNFLFSGLEVPSTAIFMARLSTLLVFGGGFLWIVFKIVMKVLDCIQTLLAALAPVPKLFYLLVFLVIPLSSDSIGARWIGYILLVLALIGLAMLAVLVLVLWKYGVEQALRLINVVRSRSATPPKESRVAPLPPESVLRPVADSPPVRTESSPPV